MGIDWNNYSDHDAEKDNVLTFLSLEFSCKWLLVTIRNASTDLLFFLLIKFN